jgi:hypothetical protein
MQVVEGSLTMAGLSAEEFEQSAKALFITQLALQLGVPEEYINLDVGTESEDAPEGRLLLGQTLHLVLEDIVLKLPRRELGSELVITYRISMPVTPAPTPAPTYLPTTLPSHHPTLLPSPSPTTTPTDTPTANPTGHPTKAPTTVGQTYTPTLGPSAAPTSPPTLPSAAPTASPSALPTSVPTAVPTSVPTAAPTLDPTSAPTEVAFDFASFVVHQIKELVSNPEAQQAIFNTSVSFDVSNDTSSAQETIAACQAGRYASGGVCLRCQAGRYQDEAGKSNCTACDPGSSQEKEEQVGCILCSLGTYQQNNTSTFCNTCGENMVTEALGAGSVKDCKCNAGFYRDEEQVCKLCPNGAVCSIGSTLRNLNTSVGYWRATVVTAVFHKCESADACVGGVIVSSIGDQCALGHEGLMCSQCDWEAGYALKYGVSCQVCEENEARNSVILCFAALFTVPFAIYLWLRRQAVLGGFGTSLGSLKGILSEKIAAMHSLFLERSTVFKIFVGFVQLLTRLGETYRLRFPIQVTLFFNCLQWFEFLDVFSFANNIQCVHRPNHLEKVFVTTLGSAVVLVVLVFMSVGGVPGLSSWFVSKCKKTKPRKKQQIHPDNARPKLEPNPVHNPRSLSLSGSLAAHTRSESSEAAKRGPISAAKERWFRVYEKTVMELYRTGVLDQRRVRDPLRRLNIGDALSAEKRSVWNLILLFTFLIYPSCNSMLMAWFDCREYEDQKQYLVVDPKILCDCSPSAVHPVTLLASDLQCDSSTYQSWINKWYVMLCTFVFVGGIPIMYLCILNMAKNVLNPKIGMIIRNNGKKLQGRFEQMRMRVGYKRAAENLKVSGLQVQ